LAVAGQETDEIVTEEDKDLSGPSPLSELSPDECRTMLGLAAVGRVGFVIDGAPIILPVNFRVLSDEAGLWILLRTRVGNVIDRAPRQVAFEIDGINHEDQTGWSVLVQGQLHHLDHNEVEVMERRFDPNPWVHDDRSSWLAIKPTVISGRKLHHPEAEWPFSDAGYM
jgi:nitroimidazol reductase NimA-like FMN-containing flavoprotein (pyridoxamine 5'-phosphate oxidase superfamily)